MDMCVKTKQILGSFPLLIRALSLFGSVPFQSFGGLWVFTRLPYHEGKKSRFSASSASPSQFSFSRLLPLCAEFNYLPQF